MPVKVHLTQTNIKKLSRHEPTLLRREQLGSGPHTLHLKPRKLRKVHTAMRKNKGLHIHLDPEELHATMSGGSVKGFFRGVGRELGHLYQKAKPMIRREVSKFVKTGLNAAVPVATTMLGVPEAAPFLQAGIDKYSDRAVGAIGQVTGAYGLRHSRKTHHRRASVSGGSFLAAGY